MRLSIFVQNKDLFFHFIDRLVALFQEGHSFVIEIKRMFQRYVSLFHFFYDSLQILKHLLQILFILIFFPIYLFHLSASFICYQTVPAALSLLH